MTTPLDTRLFHEPLAVPSPNSMASLRLAQRLSTSSGTFGSIHSTKSSRIEKHRGSSNSPQNLAQRRATRLSYPSMSHGGSNYVAALGARRPTSWQPTPADCSEFWYPPTSSREYQESYQISPFSSHGTPSSRTIYSLDASCPSLLHPPTETTTTHQIAFDQTFYKESSPIGALHNQPDYSVSTAAQTTLWFGSDNVIKPDTYQIHGAFEESRQPIQHSSQTPHLPDLELDLGTPRTHPVALEAEHGDEKVLVGLGLYDRPATPSYTFTCARNTGKGLLLEQNWQPPLRNSDDDDEYADDGTFESGDEEYDRTASSEVHDASPPFQSLPSQVPPVRLPRNAQQGRATNFEGFLPPSLDGQTFLFDDDEDPVEHWWHDIERTSAVSGAGTHEQELGSSWLRL